MKEDYLPSSNREISVDNYRNKKVEKAVRIVKRN